MRRPLCLFCAGALGLELVCAFLPQMGLLLPFAAFFVVGMFWLFRKTETRGYGLCLLLGALAGLCCTVLTRQGLEQLGARYAGQSRVLTAEVESVSASYYPGVVRATLRVEKIGEAETDPVFRIECAALPSCAAGDRITGTFQLEEPDRTETLSCYADGIALSGEYCTGFALLGQSGSFRARTCRLQKRLSSGLQAAVPEVWQETGGVLTAMVTGDRSVINPELRTAYRVAGLSHVLVISGMHISILCGGIFRKRSGKNHRPGRKERSFWSRRAEALVQGLMALLLVGVTGFTPSVLRAATAVWISALGVWLFAPADALTSLAVAGLLMTCRNSYAVCDIGFELSFAAVLGTLAGNAVFARLQKAVKKPGAKPSAGRIRLRRNALLNGLCVAIGVSLMTFPVLVLRGLSVSLYALVSGVAVVWMVEPILFFGVTAAVLSLLPWAAPARLCGFFAAGLTQLMDRWAIWVSGWKGAQLWFDTGYAAFVCLVILLLGWLAYRWRIRFRVALPALLVTAGIALGTGNALTKDLVRVELVGSKNAPSVVITQQGRAAVLFRGGASDRQAVEKILAKRGVRKVNALADLRMTTETPCGIPAVQSVAAASMQRMAHRQIVAGPEIYLEILRTQEGCAVRVTAAGRQLVTLSGNVRLARPLKADWLLASGSRPDSVQYRALMSLSTNYRWMKDPVDGEALPDTLLLRPGGGERAFGSLFNVR